MMVHTEKSIRVGIVGASAGNSWASRSHIPAITAVDGLMLTSVATSRRESADASAEQFGATNAFVGAEAMAASDDVDLIIVAVKVPHHRTIVKTALDAGKHVYCEWPLGVDLAEAELIAADAEAAVGRKAIGLQARSSPTLRYLRDLVRDGDIGTMESCSVTAYSQRGANPVGLAKRYLFNESAGANLLTIETGHLLDAICFILGEPEEIVSRAAVRRPVLRDTDDLPFAPDSADTVTAMMISASGAPVSLHLAQGTHALFKTEISIIGSSGALHLSTTKPGGIQMAPLELWGARSTTGMLELLEIPRSYQSVPHPGIASALNVAEALGAFARDIREGTHSVPDFRHAVRRHRTIAPMSTLWPVVGPESALAGASGARALQ